MTTTAGTYADRYARLKAQRAYERDIAARGVVAALRPYVVGQRELPSVDVREKVAQ
jgi:hypothetical protein